MRFLSLFEETFDGENGCEWRPPADVYRKPGGWIVKVDLAGVKPEDVKVTISSELLRVTGVRRDYFVERGYRHYSMEIAYSRFERTIRLPSPATDLSLSTDFSDGMLIVTLEKEKSTT